MMGNPLTQDGIKGLVKKLRKRGDELPNPEYNPDSVMLYQAAQALEAQEWRDIESAPKDGTIVILRRGNDVVPGFYTEDTYSRYFKWIILDDETPKQHFPPSGMMELNAFNRNNGPTHWKPLTPPETE